MISSFKQVGFYFIVVLLSSLFLYGCDNEKGVNQDNEMTKVSTRIKWFTYASYVGTYVAKDLGLWEKEGLNVEIYEGGPKIDATKLVAAGEHEFGIAGGDQILLARSKGIPIVAIVALMQETPAGFMVKKNSGIKTFKDFLGKKMRVIPGHNTEIEYRAVMKKLGLDTKLVTEVVNFSELQLFMKGEVDIEPIYLNNQPPKAESLGVEFELLTPTDYGVRSYGNVYFTTEKIIKEQPETVQAFVNGILNGWKTVFSNEEQAIDVLLKNAPKLNKVIEAKKLKLTYPLMARDDKRIGWMEAERWNEIYKELIDTNIIHNKINIESVYDDQFVRKYYE